MKQSLKIAAATLLFSFPLMQAGKSTIKIANKTNKTIKMVKEKKEIKPGKSAKFSIDRKKNLTKKRLLTVDGKGIIEIMVQTRYSSGHTTFEDLKIHKHKGSSSMNYEVTIAGELKEKGKIDVKVKKYKKPLWKHENLDFTVHQLGATEKRQRKIVKEKKESLSKAKKEKKEKRKGIDIFLKHR